MASSTIPLPIPVGAETGVSRPAGAPFHMPPADASLQNVAVPPPVMLTDNAPQAAVAIGQPTADAADALPHIRLRVALLKWGLIALLLILWGRVGWLQLVKGEEYRRLALDAGLTSRTLTPQRGAILDRNREPLAFTRRVPGLIIEPVHLATKSGKDWIQTDAALREITDLLVDFLPERRADIERWVRSGKSYIGVIGHMTVEEMARFETSALKSAIDRKMIRGVAYPMRQMRDYPLGDMGASIIGWVDYEPDNNVIYGRKGLEYYFDQDLNGEPRTVTLATDGRRRVTYLGDAGVPIPEGATVVSTLDRATQFEMDRLADAARVEHKATGVVIGVMEVKTGKIRAMAQSPRFRPGQPHDFDPDMLKLAMQNRAVEMVYEPGSTFKMVAVAAGLESGTLPVDKVFACYGGRYRIGRWPVRDVHGYATLDTAGILIKSSNICTYFVARDHAGREGFLNMFAQFRYAQRTGIEVAKEETGSAAVYGARGRFELYDWDDAGNFIPDISGYTDPRNVPEIAFANHTYGQGISITPIQLMQGYGTVANGGVLVRPTLIEEVRDGDGNLILDPDLRPAGPRVMSEKNAKALATMLVGVTEKGGTGTEARLPEEPGLKIAGKTGTAWKSDGKVYVKGIYIASFVAFFPAEDPQYVVLVVVDEPRTAKIHGGEVAAPIAREVIRRLRQLGAHD